MPLKAGCDIIRIVMKTISVSTTVGLLLYAAAPAHADYVLVLKNGRQITVQSYREEGSMIKFTGLGGEIGISKDQIQTVREIGAEGTSGLNLRELERSQASPMPRNRISACRREKPSAAEENRAQEEREYQQSISDITNRLKEVRDRYSQSIRDTTAPNPASSLAKGR